MLINALLWGYEAVKHLLGYLSWLGHSKILYLKLSRKSKAYFLAGGNLMDTCPKQRLKHSSNTKQRPNQRLPPIPQNPAISNFVRVSGTMKRKSCPDNENGPGIIVVLIKYMGVINTWHTHLLFTRNGFVVFCTLREVHGRIETMGLLFSKFRPSRVFIPRKLNHFTHWISTRPTCPSTSYWWSIDFLLLNVYITIYLWCLQSCWLYILTKNPSENDLLWNSACPNLDVNASLE